MKRELSKYATLTFQIKFYKNYLNLNFQQHKFCSVNLDDHFKN